MMKGLYETSSGWKQRAYLTIKWLKESTPHFERYVEGGENETYKKVEGMYNRIEFGSYKRTDDRGKEKEVEKYTLVLTNEDEEEIHVSTTWTGVWRQLLNTLCGALKSDVLQGMLGRISISLYMTKSGYPSVYVHNDGQPIDWFLSIDELKEMTEVEELKDGEKKFYYTKIIKTLKEQAPLLQKSTIEHTLKLDVVNEPTESKASSDDDLPFN